MKMKEFGAPRGARTPSAPTPDPPRGTFIRPTNLFPSFSRGLQKLFQI